MTGREMEMEAIRNETRLRRNLVAVRLKPGGPGQTTKRWDAVVGGEGLKDVRVCSLGVRVWTLDCGVSETCWSQDEVDEGRLAIEARGCWVRLW